MNVKEKSISIFDDDEDILALCSFILTRQGWKVNLFPDCEQILERLDAAPPDIILMDNWIPPEGGITATKLIKQTERFRHLPVIYFSANSDIKSLADQAGAEYFIAKPFDLDNFEKRLFEWASGPASGEH